MMQWFFNSIWAAWGTSILVVAACVAVWVVFPPVRKWAVIVGAAALALLSAFQHGRNTKAREEKAKRDKAVDKLERHYNEIDNRNTSDRDLTDRLRRGDF